MRYAERIMIITGWTAWKISRVMKLTKMNIKELYDILTNQRMPV